MVDYSFQDKLFGAWRDNGFKGCLDGCPSCGKTIAGKKTIEKYQKYFPYERIWIIVNSKIVADQWKEECKGMEVEIYTYPTAVTKMHKLVREGKDNQLPEMLVLDECQCIMAPSWGQVMNFGVKKYIGLSGTPNGSERVLGGIIWTVDWKDANIADTEVFFVKFIPTEDEMLKYASLSKGIEKYCGEHEYSRYKNDEFLRRLYNNRRRYVYNLKSRLPHAMKLIDKNRDKKLMIFCMHHKQALEISKLLTKSGIKHCVHISGHEEVEKFISGEVNVCISCRKISTGFNYPPADTAILVSTATSAYTAIQTLSRVIRPDPDNPDKKANIYILLADKTNDIDLMYQNIFLKEKTHKVNIDEI